MDEWRCQDNAHEAARNQRAPDRDDLATARGIGISVLLALALWLPIVATVLPDWRSDDLWAQIGVLSADMSFMMSCELGIFQLWHRAT